MRESIWFPVAVLCCLLCQATEAAEKPQGKIDFNQDVRPVLSKLCFSCHGFDEKGRKGGLRLDVAEGATGEADSGSRAIVPGKPDESELIWRITCPEESERMPPAETEKRVSAEQIEMLRKWIAEGGEYRQHWAFEKPVSVELPNVLNREWPRNEIDSFVLDRLEIEGLQPSVQGEPERLLRRVSLDLIGLPPSEEELAEYLEESRLDPDRAYAAAVDRLLNSPRFGERMATDWLDAARYADTNGYFGDRPRQAWPWRDWVINAFNANMPFDQFTIEQLAGDLLPDATREQRIATGFHRNAMANNETGIIDEEYRVEAIVDRVNATADVWLGMTLGCAQCHDHKYDPVSQQEYYQLFAYFNNSVESGLVTNDSPPPTLDVPTVEQAEELEHRQQVLNEAERNFGEVSKSLETELEQWQKTAMESLGDPPLKEAVITYDFDQENPAAKEIGTTINRGAGIRGEGGKFDATQHIEVAGEFDADHPWTVSTWFNPETSLGCLWSKIEPRDRRRGVEVFWQKGKLYINLVSQWGVDEIAAITEEKFPRSEWHHLLLTYDGSKRGAGLKAWVNGKEAQLQFKRDALTGSIQSDEPFRIGRRDSGLGFYGLLDQIVVLPCEIDANEGSAWYDLERLRGALEKPAEKRATREKTYLKEYYVEHLASPEIRSGYQNQETARKSVAEMKGTIPTTLVMEDRAESRKTFVLTRGQYDHPGIEVTAGVPKIFPAIPPEASGNRLTLAKWLVSRENPLTARVIVNRYWEICFGEGLVRTPNDFGAQGELPTHPELLDHLAVEFMESGWDLKGLLKKIVMSATYRQSSQGTEELLNRDPENRLLGRGPRFRLAAELVRDHALASSGLLSSKVGGPSVKPYQPEGLWEEVSFNEDDSYVEDEGEGLWRRSLYTYWKRQVPPPAQLTFDAGTREKCLVKRSRTNTPLQALVMMNDPTWIEASRVLAERVLDEQCLQSANRDEARLRTMYRRVVTREPSQEETRLLLSLLKKQREGFEKDREGAKQILGVGRAQRNEAIDIAEAAAWTVVAQTVLNLDEVVTRR